MKKYAVGIDPGFGRTGVVLRLGTKDLSWATMKCGPSEGTPFQRATKVADKISEVLVSMIEEHQITHLDISIETPFYNKNPATFELQWRLIQQIETFLWIVLSEYLDELWVTEVGPTTSKHLLTGSGKADKDMMVAASPFADSDILDRDDLEAIADAWGHSLAAWERAGLRTDYKNLRLGLL